MTTKIIGNAKRVRVEMPLGAKRTAWDCRSFGFGRIIAPRTAVQIELAPGMLLDVENGAVISRRRGTRSLAA